MKFSIDGLIEKKLKGEQYLFNSLIYGIIIFLAISCLDGGKNSKLSNRKVSVPIDTKKSTNSEDDKNKKEDAGTDKEADKKKEFNLTTLTEIRHFVDPLDGNYKTKISIPKNFNGYLYLSGLNVTALNDKLVSVRFNFGREMEAVTIPATIGRATGLTPQTDIQVLIMDLKDRPFQDIRLLYDIYDYNNYSSYTDTLLQYPLQNPMDPKDPRNTSAIDFRKDYLFCRGLKLEHDPTFEASISKISCESAGDKCLYSYAKIKDSGLYTASGISVIPTWPQIDFSGGDFSTSSSSGSTNVLTKNANNLKKCLPDNGNLFFKNTNGVKQLSFVPVAANLAPLGEKVLTLGSGIDQVDYVYQGPYRALSTSSWVMKPGAAFDGTTSTATPTGLFPTGGSLDPNNASTSKRAERGIKSYLFPRSGKMFLNANTTYLGNDSAFLSSTQNREALVLLSAGSTKWMDGCNIRVSNFDSYTGEGIASCNITATIEVITTDPTSRQENILNSTTKVKLQLLRASEKDISGKEVLYQSMKSCSSSKACGPDECCFNERCWSKELVSQCLEDAGAEGNYKIGEVCSSDYQCTSLCCNRSTGRCAVHNNTLDPPVFCSKPPGDLCVTKEWCRKDTVRNCLVIKTGVTAEGRPTCTLQCYNQLLHGKCSNGTCVAPRNPAVPTFNPNNPDCSTAVDPPTSFPTSE